MTFYYDSITNSFCGDSQYSDSLLQVMWHITNACNLNCKFCFSRFLRNTDVAEQTNQQVTEIINLLKQLGVKKVDLSGGEPLISRQLPLIAKCCIDNEITPTITTSGFGCDSNITWIANNYKLFARVILSLDGPGSIHNCLRGSNKAFDKFLEFYHLLTAVNCDRIRINTVVSKPVLSNAEELCKLINSLSPIEWCCIQPHPVNKNNDFDSLSVTKEEFESFIKQCQLALNNSKISMLSRNNVDYSSYWVLYPNQQLRHLSANDEYDEDFIFSSENIKMIKDAVKKHPQLYVRPTTG